MLIDRLIFLPIRFHLTASRFLDKDKVYVDEILRKNYEVEDFLWSGSGDGENETELTGTEEQQRWSQITTVFHTTTVISTSTIYFKTTSTKIQNPTTDDCSQPNGSCSISPTPTQKTSAASDTAISHHHPSTQHPPRPNFIPDQRYWLVTVLKVHTTNAVLKTSQLEEQLARLYKTAFHRHQEGHLGLRVTNDTWNQATLRSQYLSRKRRDDRDFVTVHIHNVSANDTFNILYSVYVSGVPVLATTAAHDMKLVSDAEVVAELGYPILTKAEPYIKPQLFSNKDALPKKDFLFAFISSICATLLVVLFILLVFVAVKQRKRKRAERKKQLKSGISSGTMKEGIDNAGFASENDNKTEVQAMTSTSYRKTRSNAAQTDMNGLSDFQIQSRLPSAKPKSSNSILSMPSVRDFPDTHLPEPLTSVLNAGDSVSGHDKPKFSRHSSIGGEDPGVVGPMVWQIHRQIIEKGGDPHYYGDNYSSADSDEIDVGQMRKRFDRLLDDALSFYGSRRSSNEYIDVNRTRSEYSDKEDKMRNFERRIQSAIDPRDSTDGLTQDELGQTKPYSTVIKKSRKQEMSKIDAEESATWCRNVPSTTARLHLRPLSAGPFHRPVIQPEFIFSDSQLSSADPAVPVISAIKQELDKIPEYEARDIPSNTSRKKATIFKDVFQR